jgi:Kdo2-lipid IVA lauroyltransferase/acyltransferase
MARFLLYKIGQFIVNVLPLGWAYGFAQIFSDLQYTFSPQDRRNVRSNIKIILNQDTVDEHLVREVFRNFGRYLVDFFRMVRYLDQDFIKSSIKDEHNGVEHVREVLKRGKGAIIITAHIGNWELGGVLMSKLGFPILAVALPHKHKWVNALFNEQREHSGMPVVPPTVAVRRCLEMLRANQSIALVADRDFGPHGLEMNFLGRPTLLPKGPAVLSLKTGAGIVPTFLIRNPDHTFTISFAPPVYPPFVDDQTTVGDEVLKGIINQYIKAIEDKIRQHPSQWLMFREFWVK